MKVDSESIPQILNSMDLELIYLLQYFYMKGKLSMCKIEPSKLTDTFDFPDILGFIK